MSGEHETDENHTAKSLPLYTSSSIHSSLLWTSHGRTFASSDAEAKSLPLVENITACIFALRPLSGSKKELQFDWPNRRLCSANTAKLGIVIRKWNYHRACSAKRPKKAGGGKRESENSHVDRKSRIFFRQSCPCRQRWLLSTIVKKPSQPSLHIFCSVHYSVKAQPFGGGRC